MEITTALAITYADPEKLFKLPYLWLCKAEPSVHILLWHVLTQVPLAGIGRLLT